MTNTLTHMTAGLLLVGVLAGPAAMAQAAAHKTHHPQTSPTRELNTPPPLNSPAYKAQLKREHSRAMMAGDKANDPDNPSSSNKLNEQQSAKAAALGNGPVAAPANAPADPQAGTPSTMDPATPPETPPAMDESAPDAPSPNL